ncbi:MAG: hypothetical protein UU39_C0023G0002 [Candidatus Woesebacteria bacterium GW2011_GWD1_41_12]|uniref:Purine nucleoside phosphorylase n=4 Tax=Candidatus Woeseibacteriota TaxID=1752722 RepID=A0A1F8DIB3_9BACT|nr:MAG: hypothetical protein UU39_C0023G0002 [Candidatus Woesebacteria bacterium GW2011_GWD1_41_12]KKS05278.1 MAG: hypothetical protein UU57_C0011G0007 [Candidatus Woesebacteria bacterium GW2011_GWE1_41_24]OGM88116.1 MAG: hypothetical protein A2594_01095 [Candidatus Woesebacteria bacterium RIFOXYD1_FULL_41_28]
MTNLLKRLNSSPKNYVGMLQIHGTKVVAVDKKDAEGSIENCDGLLTRNPNITLRISVADCIPLALFDPTTNSICLVHAGWRGLYKGIIGKAINLMVKKYGVDPSGVIAEIGPHICQKHYEIKSDVAVFFPGYPKAIKSIENRLFLDLAMVAKEQLIESGLKAKKIIIDHQCTYEDALLPSYRRGDFKKRIYYFLKIPDSP